MPFVSSGEASQAAQEEARSLVTHLIDTLRDQVLWLGSIGSLGHPLLFLRAGSEQQSQTKDGYSQDEEVGNKERLWVAATAAFSKLDTKTKVLFFEWLLPVLRLDHVVDSQSLAKVYLLFASVGLPATERQRFTLSLFQSSQLPEPPGTLEVGGHFQELWLLLNAIDIAGIRPTLKAHQYISRLAREQNLSDTTIWEKLKKVAPVALPIIAGVAGLLSNHRNKKIAMSAGMIGVVAGKIRIDQKADGQTNALIGLVGLQALISKHLQQDAYVVSVPADRGVRMAELRSLRNKYLDFLRCDIAGLKREQSSWWARRRGNREAAIRALLCLASEAHAEHPQELP